MSYTLYHMDKSRSVRIQWLFEELGIEYDLHKVGFNPKGHGGEEYKKIHPLNVVPSLQHNDLTMFESLAIMEYIMQTNGAKDLYRNADQDDFAEYLQFFHFGESSLTYRVANLMDQHYFFREEMKNPDVVKHHEKKLTGLLTILENQLSDHDYILASGFSAADISVGYGLLLAKIAKAGHLFTPRMAQYLDMLKSRPALAGLLSK